MADFTAQNTQNIAEKAPKNDRKKIILVIVVTAIITSVVGQKLYERWIRKEIISFPSVVEETSIESTSSNKPIFNDTIVPSQQEVGHLQTLKIYPNYNSRRFFVFTPLKNSAEGNCEYSILDGLGYNNYVVGTLPCDGWQFLHMDAFKGWAGYKVVLETDPETLSIIDATSSLSAQNPEKIKFDSEKYRLVGFDKDLTRFVYLDKANQNSAETVTYVFLDNQGKEVMPAQTFDFSSFDVVYDFVNEGLFFVHRSFGPEIYAPVGLDGVRYSILYLADDSDEMTEVFLHDSAVGGRGCGEQEVLSEEKGEFIYETGECLAIADHPSAVDSHTLKIDLNGLGQ